MTLGRVIWNRTDGSLMENGTLAPSQVQLSQAQATVTLHASASASNSTSSDSNNVTAVAAGIAVPLGVLLLASLVTITFLWSKVRSLKKELGKNGAIELSGGVSTPEDEGDREGEERAQAVRVEISRWNRNRE